MEPERSQEDQGDEVLSDVSGDYFEPASSCSEADEDSQASGPEVSDDEEEDSSCYGGNDTDHDGALAGAARSSVAAAAPVPRASEAGISRSSRSSISSISRSSSGWRCPTAWRAGVQQRSGGGCDFPLKAQTPSSSTGTAASGRRLASSASPSSFVPSAAKWVFVTRRIKAITDGLH